MKAVILVVLLSLPLAAACMIPAKCWLAETECRDYSYEDSTLEIITRDTVNITVSNCELVSQEVVEHGVRNVFTCDSTAEEFTYHGGVRILSPCPTDYYRYTPTLRTPGGDGALSIPFAEPPEQLKRSWAQLHPLLTLWLGIVALALVVLLWRWKR